jgi:hypothetical protein
MDRRNFILLEGNLAVPAHLDHTAFAGDNLVESTAVS